MNLKREAPVDMIPQSHTDLGLNDEVEAATVVATMLCAGIWRHTWLTRRK